MADPATGLPADNIAGDLSAASRQYTSPTNIGAYLWSAVAARDTRADLAGEAGRAADRPDARHARRAGAPPAVGHVLQLVRPAHRRGPAHLARGRQRPSPRSCPASTTAGWPPRCWSSQGAVPEAARASRRCCPQHELRLLLRPERPRPPARTGLMCGRLLGRHPAPRLLGGPRDGVWYTCNHYDITVTEPRIATYLGIALGQIPPTAYFAHVAHVPGHLRLVVGRSSSRPGSTPRTWACRCSRAPTRTAASSSCRAGAATCSRR